MAKILIVEDEVDLAGPIRDSLERQHHVVEMVHNGQEALQCLKVYKYDLVILDWMLPGMSGKEIVAQFRSTGGITPVIMLTARSSIEDKEAGFDAGADDYLTKPFHLTELHARVRALLRRPHSMEGKALEVAGLRLDPTARKVTRNDEEIHLLPKEFSLLEFLMRHPNQVFSAESILDRVWESDTMALPDTIRTHIKTLRKKIDVPGKPSIIVTVHGIGYKLEAP